MSVNESNTMDGVSGSINKVGRAKSNNMVICNFLAKSKLLVELSSRSSFLTLRARLAFAKFR